MKTSEVRELTIDEIKTKLVDSRNELMNLRFQIVTGQLTDTSAVRSLFTKQSFANSNSVSYWKVKNERTTSYEWCRNQ